MRCGFYFMPLLLHYRHPIPKVQDLGPYLHLALGLYLLLLRYVLNVYCVVICIANGALPFAII